MSDIQIIVRNHEGVSAKHLLNGRLHLITDSETTYETVESNGALDSDNNNTLNAAYSIDLPYGFINDTFLRPLINPHVSDQTFQSLDVILIVNGKIEPFNKLYVESNDDQAARYSVVIHDREVNPLTLAAATLLYQVPMRKMPTVEVFGLPMPDGTIVLTRELKDEWANNKYVDGENPFRFVPEWFGNTWNKGKLTIEDCRPRFSLLYLLRNGYESIGYTFQSPILETDFFRQQWVYIADESYGGNEENILDDYRFALSARGRLGDIRTEASFGANIEMTKQFGTRGFGFFDRTYRPPNNLFQTITIEYKINISKVSNRSRGSIGISSYSLVSTPVSSENPVGIERINQQIEKVDLSLYEDDEEFVEGSLVITLDQIDDILALRFIISGDDDLEVEINITNEPIKLRYIEGEPFPLHGTIRKDLDLNTLTKAAQRLVSGNITHDNANNIVRLDIPFDAEVFSQAVEGYFIEHPKADITEAIQCVSRKMAAPSRTKARHVIYGFKKTTDSYIRSFTEYSKNDMPGDKALNFGSAYEDRRIEIRNPLFEPTLLREIFTIAAATPITFGLIQRLPVHMSALQDNHNDDGQDEISFDLGARISLLSDVTTQIYLDEQGNQLGQAKLQWYDEALTEWPFYYNSLDGENFIAPGVNKDVVLVYGGSDNSLWELLLSRKAIIDYLSQIIELRGNMKLHEKYGLELRRMVAAQYESEYMTGFLEELGYDHIKGDSRILMRIPIETFASVSYTHLTLPTILRV